MGTSKKSRGVLSYLVSLWPSLPFLGFGLCAAWMALARGAVWLSPGEATGVALTNFLMVVNIAMGVLLMVAGLFAGRLGRFVTHDRAVLVAGVAASAGSLALLLIGPAFFQQSLGGVSHAVFQVSSVVIGLSLGVMYLRLGMLYARLPLRRAILYLCYAHLLAIFIYLAIQVSPQWTPVEGSPSLAFMVAFVVLPVLAALTFKIDANLSPWVGSFSARGGASQVQPSPRPQHPSAPQQALLQSGEAASSVPAGTSKAPRRSVAHFAVALFLFAFAQSVASTAVTSAVAPSYTLDVSNLDMLVRIPLLLVFALLASMLEARRLDFGRLLVGLVSLLVVVILVGLVTGISGVAWLVTARTVAFGFEVLTWCMIFAVANCHWGQSAAMVALNFGAFSLGMGFGALASVEALATFGEFALLVACVILLVPCFLLLDARNVEGLFATQDDEGGASLRVLLGDSLQGGTPRMKGDFRRRLEEYAASKGLSSREAEVLRYLVAGRGDSQIAEAMGISYNTARTHVRNVYTKLDVHNRQTLIDVINDELS